MTVFDLLMAQHRWGRERTRRFLRSIPLGETKTLGSMTDRQRREVAARLEHGYERSSLTPDLLGLLQS
jgi:hypothetical protein